MCFSQNADLVVGALLVPVGVAALREVRERRELPFALLPLLFAAHQLVESLVWGGAEGQVSTGLAHAAAVAYVVFALPVLPTLVPAAVLLLEPPGRRRRVSPFLLLGVVVTTYFVLTLARHGVDVRIEPHAIVYGVGLSHSYIWTTLYVVAVMGAAVCSGYRSIVAFGVGNLVGLSVVALVYADAFASLWCIYAAVTSGLVLVHLVRRHALLGRPRRACGPRDASPVGAA